MAGNGTEIQDDRAHAVKTNWLINAGLILPIAAILSHVVPTLLYLYTQPRGLPMYLAVPALLAALAGPPIGLLSGYWALRRLHRHAAPGRRRALLSVWLGWVSFVTLCAAALTPAYTADQRDNRSGRSRANLRAIGEAVALYRADFGNAFPPSLQAVAYEGYAKDLGIFTIPPLWPWSEPRTVNPTAIDVDGDYAYVPLLREPPRPGDVPIAWEKDTRISARGVNVLFGDLHVSSEDAEELLGLLARYRDYYAATPQPPLVASLSLFSRDILDRPRTHRHSVSLSEIPR